MDAQEYPSKQNKIQSTLEAAPLCYMQGPSIVYQNTAAYMLSLPLLSTFSFLLSFASPLPSPRLSSFFWVAEFIVCEYGTGICAFVFAFVYSNNYCDSNARERQR